MDSDLDTTAGPPTDLEVEVKVVLHLTMSALIR